MRAKLAAPVALASAVAVFFVAFVVSGSLVWSPLLALAAALGLYLILDDRSPAQASSDDYLADAQRKVDEALRRIREVKRQSAEVASPAARTALETACRYVPELFDRVRATAPNSVYSSASQMSAHIASLSGAVGRYLDIQRKPELYTDSAALMHHGELAFQRFADFTVESIRLVNSGDIAQYRANLETVAPPQLPELG